MRGSLRPAPRLGFLGSRMRFWPRCCHIEATSSMRQAPPPEEELNALTMLHLNVEV
jgi:hypothetical protein